MAVYLTGKPVAAGIFPLDGRELVAVVEAMLARGGMAFVRVELTLMDDFDMRALHLSSLGCDGPTNVLSFPALGETADNGDPGTGCLALSVDTLRREAFLYGLGESEYAIRLLAHGLAHLLGYDHGPVMDVLSADLEAAGHAALWQKVAHPCNFATH